MSNLLFDQLSWLIQTYFFAEDNNYNTRVGKNNGNTEIHAQNCTR